MGRDRWVYLWADGIYSGLRAEHQKLCVLVVIGVNERGDVAAAQLLPAVGETPVAVVEPDAGAGPVGVARGQIGCAVAVEVARGHGESVAAVEDAVHEGMAQGEAGATAHRWPYSAGWGGGSG